MRKWIIYLVSAFIGFSLLLPLDIAEARAKKVQIQKAPKFPRRGIWLNLEFFRKEDLFREKATLIYFWDYTSINCLRELNYLKQWHRRYHPYGFELVMIHAPEFDFARRKEYVKQAVKKFGIPFPVFLDNDFKLWEKYGTRTWPTKFLVDPERTIVHSQGGEERYLEMEDKLRELLKKIRPETILPEPVLLTEENKFNAEQCGPMSSETYMGYARAGWWGGGVANRKGVLPDQTLYYRDRGKRVERGFFVEGLWTNRKDHFEHARDTEALMDYLGISYAGYEAYAVMSQAEGEGSSRVYVTRDDIPVPYDRRGRDLREDPVGNTYLFVQEPRLYYLITAEDDGLHELKLWTQKKGLTVNSFSFSNRCLSDFEHL
jgi:hypothetical protein